MRSWFAQFFVLTVLPVLHALTGDHVCHRVENYTVTSSESYTEPVIVQSFTWCLQVPPRCLKSRTEMRKRYRIKTEVKQRTIQECCEGYIEQGTRDDAGGKSRCVPFCDDCQQGICIRPNVCICKSGFQGDNCTHECPDCSMKCDCGPAGTCNPISGSCECQSGWEGDRCDKPCTPGFWGPRCAFPCTCEGEHFSCRPETGTCLTEYPLEFDERMSGRNISTSTTESTTSLHRQINNENTSADDDGSQDPRFSTHTRYLETTEHSVKDISENPIESESKESISTHDPYDSTSESTSTSSNDLRTSESISEQTSPEYEDSFASTQNTRVSIKDEGLQSDESIEDESAMINTVPLKTDYVKTVHKEDAPVIPFDVTVLIVIGSVVSLGLTSIAVLMIFHMRSRLFESVRLSIYNNGKAENGQKKDNGEKVPKIVHHTLPPPPTFVNPVFTPNPEGALITFDGAELNQNYANRTATISIRLSGNLRDLLESHYDRPPAATCCHKVDMNTEHVYDEIPLTTPLCVRKET